MNIARSGTSLSRLLIGATLTASLLLAGCGEDGARESNAKPDPSVSDTAANETTPAEPEGPESATGAVVEDEFYSVHLPEELDWDFDPGDTLALAKGPNYEPYEISVNAVRLPPGRVGQSVDDDFKFSAEARVNPPLKRGENRVVDGVEGWTSEVTADYAGDPALYYTYGTSIGEWSFDISFAIYSKDPRARDLIESTLASLKWKQ